MKRPTFGYHKWTNLSTVEELSRYAHLIKDPKPVKWYLGECEICHCKKKVEYGGFCITPRNVHCFHKTVNVVSQKILDVMIKAL